MTTENEQRHEYVNFGDGVEDEVLKSISREPSIGRNVDNYSRLTQKNNTLSISLLIGSENMTNVLGITQP